MVAAPLQPLAPTCGWQSERFCHVECFALCAEQVHCKQPIDGFAAGLLDLCGHVVVAADLQGEKKNGLSKQHGAKKATLVKRTAMTHRPCSVENIASNQAQSQRHGCSEKYHRNSSRAQCKQTGAKQPAV